MLGCVPTCMPAHSHGIVHDYGREGQGRCEHWAAQPLHHGDGCGDTLRERPMLSDASVRGAYAIMLLLRPEAARHSEQDDPKCAAQSNWKTVSITQTAPLLAPGYGARRGAVCLTEIRRVEYLPHRAKRGVR